MEFDKTCLIGGPEQRDIEICEYDTRWPRVFESHARTIREALGDTALRIEHIGSTSVPGLAAKPIIDILVVIAHPEDEDSYLNQLLSAGYELSVREPGFDEHRMVRTANIDTHRYIV